MENKEIVRMLLEMDRNGQDYYLSEEGWNELYKTLEEIEEEKAS